MVIEVAIKGAGMAMIWLDDISYIFASRDRTSTIVLKTNGIVLETTIDYDSMRKRIENASYTALSNM